MKKKYRILSSNGIDEKLYVNIAINKHGGIITIYDTIDLQLARKR